MQTIMKRFSVRNTSGLLIAALMSAAIGTAARAEENCGGFKWPVDTEFAWMKAQDTQAVSVGGKLAEVPAKAIELKLDLTSAVKFPVAPGIKKQAMAPNSHSGWFTIEKIATPGLYQVSLSQHAWIDIVQNGELIQSTAFTGSKGCKALGKSVRFEIGVGPAVVQVGGVDGDTVKVTIRAATDK